MIRHVVVFTWDDGMTDELEQQLAAELTGLAPKLSGLRAYHAGPDVGLVEGNFDFAVVGDFEDVASYVAYRDHPEHQDIVGRLSRPHTKARAAVQFEI
ncbi:MAG: Dabb family protein [Actinobacteria bacterium]|nr:Dabb family protein [Actinomycetota bacterium]MBO0834560.1 Dabb family protein [Actinomycetota bacterium]